MLAAMSGPILAESASEAQVSAASNARESAAPAAETMFVRSGNPAGHQCLEKHAACLFQIHVPVWFVTAIVRMDLTKQQAAAQFACGANIGVCPNHAEVSNRTRPVSKVGRRALSLAVVSGVSRAKIRRIELLLRKW